MVVAAEMFVNEYLPEVQGGTENANDDGGYNLPNELDISAAINANVLGADEFTNVPNEIVREVVEETPVGTGFDSNSLDTFVFENDGFLEPTGELSGGSLGDSTFDLEDFSSSYDHAATKVYLTNEQIQNSGFTGAYLEPEDFDGFLYKTVTVGDLYGINVDKYSITNGQQSYAKVYVIRPQDIGTVGELYSVLKVRASEGLEVEVNETNTFGDASFYMNDLRRQHVAFLTVRMGATMYGFAYAKDYHLQVQNLVKLLN